MVRIFFYICDMTEKGKILLDLDYLVENFKYSHLWKLNENLLDNKLETLIILDKYNEIKLSGNIDSELEEEFYSFLIDLEFLNKNITTVQLAMKLKSKECIEHLDCGTYFLN